MDEKMSRHLLSVCRRLAGAWRCRKSASEQLSDAEVVTTALVAMLSFGVTLKRRGPF